MQSRVLKSGEASPGEVRWRDSAAGSEDGGGGCEPGTAGGLQELEEARGRVLPRSLWGEMKS